MMCLLVWISKVFTLAVSVDTNECNKCSIMNGKIVVFMSLDTYNDSAKRAPIVVDVHKEALVKRGYRDFADWAARPGHVYVGRNMSFYVKGPSRRRGPIRSRRKSTAATSALPCTANGSRTGTTK